MFAERLKEMRKELKLTQRELADKLKVRDTTISKYELSQREPDIKTLDKLSEILGVSVDYLIGKTNIRKSLSEEHTTKETIAAHHDGTTWSEEELAEIEKFKEFIKSKRNNE